MASLAYRRYRLYHRCMSRTMPLREVRDFLGQRVDAAHFGGETTIITKNGHPRAAIVPHAEYERLADLESRVARLEQLTTYPPQND